MQEFLRTPPGQGSRQKEPTSSAGSNRRVPGLRREEVALLAGVSVDYYAQLERGDLSRVSDEVLDALARALQLDEAETSHLFDLASAGSSPPGTPQAPRAAANQVRPSLQRFLDAITDAPAWVRDERMDFVATNRLGRALNAPLFAEPRRPVNNARFVFLNEEASRQFYLDWEKGADDIVAAMRRYAGQHPHDKQLTDLIGELVTRSDAFRTRWAAHNVRFHRTGVKRLHHPVVGDLELVLRGPRPARRSRLAPVHLHRRTRAARPTSGCASWPAGPPPSNARTPAADPPLRTRLRMLDLAVDLLRLVGFQSCIFACEPSARWRARRWPCWQRDARLCVRPRPAHRPPRGPRSSSRGSVQRCP